LKHEKTHVENWHFCLVSSSAYIAECAATPAKSLAGGRYRARWITGIGIFISYITYNLNVSFVSMGAEKFFFPSEI
jgi:hypothetical protein